MQNLSIKVKLLALFAVSLSLLFLNIFIFTIFINKNSKTFEDVIYKQGLQSIQLILNADRDYYQALLAMEELTYNKNANRKDLLDSYKENVDQTAERTTKAKDILLKNQENWSKYKSEESGQTIFEEFDNFKTSFEKWQNDSILLFSGKGSLNSQKESFENVRGHLNVITNILNDSADKKIVELNNSTQAGIITIVIACMALTIVLSSVIFVIVSKMTENLGQIINNLTDNANQMNVASEQVSETSQLLAGNTSEQASAIQETSATLEETSSMVHQNRENTQQAVVLAKKAKQFAEQSNDEMTRMSDSMSKLKNSSNEIAKIIKVIDEIAFQTNILSLNAAVEAARAGDAGKGFAVVAEEVRNLAQRSAQAAKDTTVIIESNINLSDSSVNIANAVKDSVASIGEQAAKVSDLLEEIAVATSEQAQGVEQINQAVSQMETAIQSNAVTADQSAAASSTLQEQAISVRQIVDSLVVLVDGADAAVEKSKQLKIRAKRSIESVKVRPKKAELIPAKATKPSPKEAKQASPENVIPLNDF